MGVGLLAERVNSSSRRDVFFISHVLVCIVTANALVLNRCQNISWANADLSSLDSEVALQKQISGLSVSETLPWGAEHIVLSSCYGDSKVEPGSHIGQLYFIAR